MITTDAYRQVLAKIIAMPFETKSWEGKIGKFGEFVECCKLIIDWQKDVENGFVIEFSDNYDKLRKRPIVEYQRWSLDKNLIQVL